MPHHKVCVNCHWKYAWVKDRCQACYMYKRRHGVERPFELIQRAAEREDERRFR